MTARPYLNPYVAGVGLGLVLLAAFVFAGRGLGASGAFSSVVAHGAATVAPAHAAEAAPYAGYLETGLLHDWLVLEMLGVLLGGLISAVLMGRFRLAVDRGPAITDRARLRYALGGGVLMGVGAKIARGCTSGLALTGGAQLSVGAWIFIAAAFGAGYAAAPLFRRAWT